MFDKLNWRPCADWPSGVILAFRARFYACEHCARVIREQAGTGEDRDFGTLSEGVRVKDKGWESNLTPGATCPRCGRDIEEGGYEFHFSVSTYSSQFAR